MKKEEKLCKQIKNEFKKMHFGQIWKTTECSGLCNYKNTTAKTRTTFYKWSLKSNNRYMHGINKYLVNEISQKTYLNH